MSMLSSQINELREAARQFEGYQNGEISRMMREAADTIESLRDRLQELQGVTSESRYSELFGTPEQAIAATLGSETCKCVAEHVCSPFDGKTIVIHRCSVCHEFMRPFMKYCPGCGAKVIEEVDNADE